MKQDEWFNLHVENLDNDRKQSKMIRKIKQSDQMKIIGRKLSDD